MNQTVQIGDKVKDAITGLEGICVARTVWINGCVRCTIQPQEVKDGKAVEMTSLDEPQLVVLERRVIAPEPEQTPKAAEVYEPRRKAGGPRDDARALSR